MTEFKLSRPFYSQPDLLYPPIPGTQHIHPQGRVSGIITGQFPSNDYVGSLTGALGQIDINSAMHAYQTSSGGASPALEAPSLDPRVVTSEYPEGLAGVRQYHSGSAPQSPYGQPGSNGAFPPSPGQLNMAVGNMQPSSPANNGANGYVPMSYMPAYPMMATYAGPYTARMTGNYGPAAAAAAAAAAGNLTGRTVYIGSIPDDASADELLNLVRFGPIESVKILSDKSCVFISFLDGSTAAAFYADAAVKKLALRGQELRIGWGRESGLPTSVAIAVQYNQATRNVFIGGLTDDDTEQTLRADLVKFGDIDQIKIVRDKNIAFVHFLSISVAMKVVASLPREPNYRNKRVSYGKDRCAYVPRAQQAAVRQAVAQATAAVQSHTGQMVGSMVGQPYGFPGYGAFSTGSFDTGLSGGGPTSVTGGGGAFGMNGYIDPNQIGNRSIYLGNINSETTVEELCNNIRGGVLESIKVLPEKKCAFVTFIDPAAALAFFRHSDQNPIATGGRRLRIGWGKAPPPVTPKLLAEVQQGASRNVYIGQITDFETFTHDRLQADFGQFGEIELINFLKEKHAAYVNFTTIEAAQKAIADIKTNEVYAGLRIAHGKDRCGYPPRPSRPQGRRDSRRPSEDDPVAAAIAAAEAAAIASEEALPNDDEFELAAPVDEAVPVPSAVVADA